MHQGWALATRDAGVRKGGVSGRVVADLNYRDSCLALPSPVNMVATLKLANII